MDVVQRVAIPAQRHAGFGQRLDLRCEIERAIVHRVVQGLDAETITGGEELPITLVPDGECELPPERRECPRAAILEEVQRNLAVGPRPERVPVLFELAPDPFEIVELAVDDDP
jgi:hypothetical protein